MSASLHRLACCLTVAVWRHRPSGGSPLIGCSTHFAKSVNTSLSRELDLCAPGYLRREVRAQECGCHSVRPLCLRSPNRILNCRQWRQMSKQEDPLHCACMAHRPPKRKTLPPIKLTVWPARGVGQFPFMVGLPHITSPADCHQKESAMW